MTGVPAVDDRGRVAAAVAAGGAVGALLGHLTGLLLAPLAADPSPVAILLVNVVGAHLLARAVRREQRPVAAAFVRTGLLGSFTTFGALAVLLADPGDPVRLALAGLGILGGLAAVRLAGPVPPAPVGEGVSA